MSPTQTVSGLATHPAWMEFDLDALAANYAELLRRAGPDIKIIASLKANAYGHGIVEAAKILSKQGIFAISTGSFRDAIAVREAGIDKPILMFGGNLPAGVADYLRHDLIPTVYNMETAQAVSQAAAKPVPVYVKVDAGMGRLGIELQAAETFIRAVAKLPNVVLEGVYTHLSFKDAPGQAWSQQGIERFNELIGTLRNSGLDVPVTQAVASSNMMVGYMDGCNAICPGHILYGLPSVDADLGDITPFQPVLTGIKAQLIHIGEFPEGTAAQGGGYHLKRQSRRTGVVPLGLYDGCRKPRDGVPAAVLLKGRRMPIIGVSLEHLTFDMLDFEDAAIGDTVTVLGEDGTESISLADLADWQGCGLLDVLMNFDGRLPGRYRGIT